MTSKMHVQVVTPNGLIFDGEAGFITAKTVDGNIGILAHHMPIIVPLAIDKLIIKEAVHGKVTCEIAINGGILECRDNLVTVLANSAETSETIDLDRALRAKERAEKRLQEAKNDHQVDRAKRAEVALARAVNRIHVSRK